MLCQFRHTLITYEPRSKTFVWCAACLSTRHIEHGHSGAATGALVRPKRRIMTWLRSIRTLLLSLAIFGYLANGAQAHVQISEGESLSLMLCGTGTAHTIELVIPGDPVEELTDTCCGDCSTPSAHVAPNAKSALSALRYEQPLPTALPSLVSPKSPLWPGAPPHGPPVFLTT